MVTSWAVSFRTIKGNTAFSIYPHKMLQKNGKFDKLLCTPSAVLRCYLLSRFPEIDISGNEKDNWVLLQPWIVNGAKKKQIYQGILFSQLTKHCYSMPFCLHVLSLSDSLSVPLFKAGPENLFYAEVFFHRWARMHIPLPSIGLHSSQFFSNHRQERIRSIFIFIGPESDHWECLSVTDWLTDWLPNSLTV